MREPQRAVVRVIARGLREPLHLAFTYDEEVGCLGVRHECGVHDYGCCSSSASG